MAARLMTCSGTWPLAPNFQDEFVKGRSHFPAGFEKTFKSGIPAASCRIRGWYKLAVWIGQMKSALQINLR
jgi:hypothetical protein